VTELRDAIELHEIISVIQEEMAIADERADYTTYLPSLACCLPATYRPYKFYACAPQIYHQHRILQARMRILTLIDIIVATPATITHDNIVADFAHHDIYHKICAIAETLPTIWPHEDASIIRK
jgi:hypothetical protein